MGWTPPSPRSAAGGRAGCRRFGAGAAAFWRGSGGCTPRRSDPGRGADLLGGGAPGWEGRAAGCTSTRAGWPRLSARTSALAGSVIAGAGPRTRAGCPSSVPAQRPPPRWLSGGCLRGWWARPSARVSASASPQGRWLRGTAGRFAGAGVFAGWWGVPPPAMRQVRRSRPRGRLHARPGPRALTRRPHPRGAYTPVPIPAGAYMPALSRGRGDNAAARPPLRPGPARPAGAGGAGAFVFRPPLAAAHTRRWQPPHPAGAGNAYAAPPAPAAADPSPRAQVRRVPRRGVR